MKKHLIDYLYTMKKKKKPKVKKGKKGSFNKTLNNEISFVTKVPKTPKGSSNVTKLIKRAMKKKGGKSTEIIIKTTSAKFTKKERLAKLKKKAKKSFSQIRGTDPNIAGQGGESDPGGGGGGGGT